MPPAKKVAVLSAVPWQQVKSDDAKFREELAAESDEESDDSESHDVGYKSQEEGDEEQFA